MSALEKIMAGLVKVVGGKWQCCRHPGYQVLRAPTADCRGCKILWDEKEAAA